MSQRAAVVWNGTRRDARWIMLNPNAIFRKTERGNAEITDRKLGLRAELRRLLILIDGRNSVAKLAAVVRVADIDPLIYELQAQGLIDTSAAATGSPSAAVGPPTVAPLTVTGTMIGPTGVDTTPAPTKEQFLAARSAAVHFINDNLGPSGESLAIKLERTRSPQELREAIALVRLSVERLMSAAAAQRFLDHVRTSIK